MGWPRNGPVRLCDFWSYPASAPLIRSARRSWRCPEPHGDAFPCSLGTHLIRSGRMPPTSSGASFPWSSLACWARLDSKLRLWALILAALSGAIATGLGYIVWYLALHDLPATHAATVQLSMPALVALGGTALLSEPLTMRLLTASAMMLGGIAVVLRQRVERSMS